MYGGSSMETNKQDEDRFKKIKFYPDYTDIMSDFSDK